MAEQRRTARLAAVCVALATAAGAAVAAPPAQAVTGTDVPIASSSSSSASPEPGSSPSPSGPAGEGASADAGVVLPAADPVERVALMRSSPSVYPVHDGYRDTVRFVVRALDADGHPVPVTGTAALTRGAATARTWTLQGTDEAIVWDGRIRGRVRTGSFRLRVAVRSADGARATASVRVRVVGKRLRHRRFTVRQDVGARSTAAALPKRVAAAFAVGPVTVRVRTDAVVAGPALLTFTGDGVTRSIRLRGGVHLTRPLPLLPGFEQVAIGHRWRTGAARLRSVEAVWSYSELR